jgi:hypothetical protein
MQYRRRILNFPTLQLSDSLLKAHTLLDIEKIMQQAGRSMKDYPQIELPNSYELREIGNKLMNEKTNYDIDIQRDDHQRISRTLNNEQKIAFNTLWSQ